MGRILAIDYGKKRTGLAVTDPLKIIPGGLTTIDTKDLMKFLKDYIAFAMMSASHRPLPTK